MTDTTCKTCRHVDEPSCLGIDGSIDRNGDCSHWQAAATPICADVDEYTCAECKGHNRCEDEMAAGFGDYGRDDPREER